MHIFVFRSGLSVVDIDRPIYLISGSVQLFCFYCLHHRAAEDLEPYKAVFLIRLDTLNAQENSQCLQVSAVCFAVNINVPVSIH